MTNKQVNIPKNQAIVLFDGICNFCSQSVQFIIKHDRKGYFLFAPLQSKTAKSLFSDYSISSIHLNSIVLVEGEKFYTESTAVLRICKNLRGLWKGLYIFIIIPKGVRDALYRSFAKRRYQFFGRKESCMVPSPNIRRRFLEINEQKDEESNS